jgi:hypothetical protein
MTRILFLLMFLAPATASAASVVPAGGLESPATVTIRGATAADACAELARTTGLSLRCADPFLARRPVVLFAAERPVVEMMEALAEALRTEPGRCEWRRVGERFELIQSAGSRAARRALLRRLQRERAREFDARGRRLFQLDGAGEAELDDARRRDPELVAALPQVRIGAPLLQLLDRHQQAALGSGREVGVPIGALPLAHQELVRSLVAGTGTLRLTIPHDSGDLVFTWSVEDLPTTPLLIRFVGEPDRPGVRCTIPTVPGSPVTLPNLFYPEVPPAEHRLPWLREALEAREKEELRQREAELAPLREDPDLRKLISVGRVLEPDSSSESPTRRRADLSGVLAQVAKESGLGVVGDYDPCWDDYYRWNDSSQPGAAERKYLPADLEKLPVLEVMEVVRRVFRVEWKKRGAWIFITSPRVPFAEIDGLDLLDHRPQAPPEALKRALEAAG